MIVRTAAKMRAHLDDFSGKLSAGLSQPARRFVSEALYRIAARGSVRLAEIGRALEETIALIKTETRLSRNLGRPELRAHLGGAVLREGSARIGARTLLVLDISDIAKPYAQKMEYLARVRDGSTGELAKGYWLCQVIAVENEEAAIVPLYSALYSQRAPDFQSENEEIKTAFSKVSAACDGRGGCGLWTGAGMVANSMGRCWLGSSPSSSATPARAMCRRDGARWRAPVLAETCPMI